MYMKSQIQKLTLNMYIIWNIKTYYSKYTIENNIKTIQIK